MRAVLDPIAAQTLLDYLKTLSDPWDAWTAVTLIDGDTIVGHCGGSAESAFRATGIASFEQDLGTRQYLTDHELVLSYTDPSVELRLYVPLTDIAPNPHF